MSTASSLGLNTATLRTSLPYLTGALHTMGIVSGLYFLLTPSEGAKLFGTPFKNESAPTPNELAFTRIHAIRDLTMGVIGLRLINYAYAMEVKGDQAGARAVGYAVGSLVLSGVVFTLGDGWICNEFANVVKVRGEERELTEDLVRRHTVLAAPIAVLGLAWLYL